MPQNINEKWTGGPSDPNQPPQAVNDVLNGVAEDPAYTFGIATLLGNDRGGEAKTLYNLHGLIFSTRSPGSCWGFFAIFCWRNSSECAGACCALGRRGRPPLPLNHPWIKGCT